MELGRDSKIIHKRLWFKIATELLVDKICLLWINYKNDILKWLLEWWFKKENIINKIENINQNTIILLEWRRAKKFNF